MGSTSYRGGVRMNGCNHYHSNYWEIYYLVQARIEPWNVSKWKTLLWSSIQASWSNCQAKHWWKRPPLSEVFDENNGKHIEKHSVKPQPQDWFKFHWKYERFFWFHIENQTDADLIKITDNYIWTTRSEIELLQAMWLVNSHLTMVLWIFDRKINEAK